MANNIKIKPFKMLAAFVLFSCLLFLSGINFFLFAQNTVTTSLNKSLPGKETPESPIEDKVPETKSFSAFPEYLPEQLLQILCFGNKARHCIHKSGQLHVVYFEIVAPPPKA